MTAPRATPPLTTAPSANPQLTTRKRGLRALAIAVVLLVLALILMGTFRPAEGAHYSLPVRLVLYLLFGSGWFQLFAGLYRVIDGPGTGALAAPLRVLAMTVAFVGAVGGVVGAWAMHDILNDPHHDSDDDLDWD